MSDEGVAAGRLGGRGVGGTGLGRGGKAAATTASATAAGGVGRHVGRIAGEVPRATSTAATSTGGAVLLLQLLIVPVVLPGLKYFFQAGLDAVRKQGSTAGARPIKFLGDSMRRLSAEVGAGVN